MLQNCMNYSTTIHGQLNFALKRLHGIESARLDAELLLCLAINTERTTVYSRPDQEIPQQQIDTFHTLVSKRSEGYPMAYITGNKEFWSINLIVNEHTLIPRPETECLVERALEKITPAKKVNIIDLGTGSGAIAIAIAKERPDCRIIATDNNAKALAIAAANAKTYGLENIIFVKSDWFGVIDKQHFAFVVSNPPYVRHDDVHLQQGGIRFEPPQALIAGDDGLQAIRRIIDQALDYMAEDGWLLLEHGYDQGNAVRNLLSTCFFGVTTSLDYADHERVTIARYKS